MTKRKTGFSVRMYLTWGGGGHLLQGRENDTVTEHELATSHNC